MKKMIAVLLMATIVLGGCEKGDKDTRNEHTKPNIEDAQNFSSQATETETGEELKESNVIDGFEKPEYEKFNSYASENGLDGTMIYIEGKVLNQTKMGDSEPPVLSLVVEQADGKRWCVGVISDSEIEDIQEKNVRVFGIYQGFSDVMNLPAVNVVTEDVDLMDKVKIEVEENGEYIKVLSFADYVFGDSEEPDTQDKADTKPLTLSNSGWCSYKTGDWTHVPYAVQIENPNAEYAVEFPTITITAKDSEGKILKTDDRTLFSIAAGDTIFYGDDIFYEGDEPATVEISVSAKDRNFAKQDEAKYAMQSDFEISNISENNGYSKKITGEITNNSDIDFDSIVIIAIYKSGENIIGGEVEYMDDLAAGATKAFELSSDSDKFEYDSYEFYAIQW